MYLLSHAGKQQSIHSLQSRDGPLLLLVVETLEEKEKGEEEKERRRRKRRRRRGGEGRGGIGLHEKGGEEASGIKQTCVANTNSTLSLCFVSGFPGSGMTSITSNIKI